MTVDIRLGSVNATTFLDVTNGATINTGVIIVGGTTTLLIDGEDSSVTCEGISVGANGGDSDVDIVNGGQLRLDGLTLGSVLGIGNMYVDGGVVVVDNGEDVGSLRIGSSIGTSTANVVDGGIVLCDECIVADSSSEHGTVSINGPSIVTVNENLFVGGSCLGPGGNGTFTVGRIGFPGAMLDVGESIVIYAAGELALRDGSFINSGLIHFEGVGGQFNFEGGFLNVGVFGGNLVNSAGVVTPGQDAADSTVINGDFLQQGGVLAIGVGGPVVAVETDFCDVNGNATLGGELELSLIDGFVPERNQTFTVLNANDLSGFFENVSDNQRLETVDQKGSFLVRYGPTSPNPNQIILSDYLPNFILGDVNDDGVVNLLDVGPFIDVLTNGPFSLAADINMDGQVNLLDVGPFVALLTG